MSVQPPAVPTRRSTLPWYWTDEIVASLPDDSMCELLQASCDPLAPVAIRRTEETLEELLSALEEDSEPHLAA